MGGNSQAHETNAAVEQKSMSKTKKKQELVIQCNYYLLTELITNPLKLGKHLWQQLLFLNGENFTKV